MNKPTLYVDRLDNFKNLASHVPATLKHNMPKLSPSLTKKLTRRGLIVMMNGGYWPDNWQTRRYRLILYRLGHIAQVDR